MDKIYDGLAEGPYTRENFAKVMERVGAEESYLDFPYHSEIEECYVSRWSLGGSYIAIHVINDKEDLTKPKTTKAWLIHVCTHLAPPTFGEVERKIMEEIGLFS